MTQTLQSQDEIGVSLIGIDILQSLGGDTGEADSRTVLQAALSNLVAFEYVQSDSVSPAMVAGRSSQVGVLCVHGTDLPAQYVPQVTGWLNGILGQGGPKVQFPANPWIQAAGDRAYNLGARVGLWSLPFLYVFGHSAGHGISSTALYTALELRTGGVIPLIQNISFGGNGFANQAKIAAYGLANVTQIRWMNSEDPVPLFPWCCTQMLGGNTFLAPDTLQAILNVQHLNGGRDLPRTGPWVARTLPSAASVSPGSSVVEWLRTIEQGTDNMHMTGEYKRRLAALPAVNEPQWQPTGRSHSGDTPTASEAPLNIAIPATQAEAARQLPDMVAAAQAAAAALVPPPPVVLPGFPFEARKGNGAWGVVRGDVQVATPGDKAAAKALARKLNRLERDVESFDDENILEAFAFYTQ